MSRIDDIKVRLIESFPMDHNSLMKKIEWCKSDIMEMIERLEIADKALSDIVDYLRLEEKFEALDFVHKAQQQLRS